MKWTSTNRGVGGWAKARVGSLERDAGSCAPPLDSSQDSRMVCLVSLLTGSLTGRCAQQRGFRSAIAPLEKLPFRNKRVDPIEPQSFNKASESWDQKPAEREQRGGGERLLGP